MRGVKWTDGLSRERERRLVGLSLSASRIPISSLLSDTNVAEGSLNRETTGSTGPAI